MLADRQVVATVARGEADEPVGSGAGSRRVRASLELCRDREIAGGPGDDRETGRCAGDAPAGAQYTDSRRRVRAGILRDATPHAGCAQLKANRPELERLRADDYTLAGSNGKNETKAESIADLVAPGRTTTYVAITRQVRKAWSNGAALGGMVDARGRDHGRPFVMRARFVDVWAKRNGRWQVIFTQIDDVSAGRIP